MRVNTLPAIALAGLALSACRDVPVAPVAAPPLRDVTAQTSAPATNAPQDLGVLGTSAQAFGISANATVVGQFDTPSGDIRAFMWTSKTGLTQLASPAGSTQDWAWSVNDAGQAVGYSNLPSQNAILWTKGVPYNLGTLAGGAGASMARGINRTGQVVGESSIQGEFGPVGVHAMLWVPNATNGTTGTMYDLGAPPDGSSRAYAVNDGGQVVGTMMYPDATFHAFLWTPNVLNGTVGTMVDIDPTGTYSEAYGLNDRGDVVGQHAVAGGGVGAFIWNAATGMRDIGTFLGGGNSAADGVDRLGRVVGLAVNSAGYFRPFVWTSKTGIQDLGTLGGNTGEAFATNPKGQAVGFSQTGSGQNHATLWTLP
jgi:probable HAF family extracellular repeat protein